ncbi:hypothetical protein [Priestia aryabhattai]
MAWIYLNMLVGIFITVVNLYDSPFQGVFRWMMVGCGVLIFARNLIMILKQKQNKEINQERN